MAVSDQGQHRAQVGSVRVGVRGRLRRPSGPGFVGHSSIYGAFAFSLCCLTQVTASPVNAPEVAKTSTLTRRSGMKLHPRDDGADLG